MCCAFVAASRRRFGVTGRCWEGLAGSVSLGSEITGKGIRLQVPWLPQPVPSLLEHKTEYLKSTWLTRFYEWQCTNLSRQAKQQCGITSHWGQRPTEECFPCLFAVFYNKIGFSEKGLYCSVKRGKLPSPLWEEMYARVSKSLSVPHSQNTIGP